MQKLISMLKILISIPKTVYFNFRALPFKEALRMPVIVCYNVKLLKVRRHVIRFSSKVRTGMVHIGFGGSWGVISNRHGAICLEGGSVTFKGRAGFAEGSSIRVSGDLVIGENLSSNKNLFLSCAHNIVIGDNVMFGWNCAVRDSDGHIVYHKGEAKPHMAPVHIGNHVWICSEAHILKGVTIGEESVVAYRSLVTKSFEQPGLLIGGSPAKEIQQDISFGHLPHRIKNKKQD